MTDVHLEEKYQSGQFATSLREEVVDIDIDVLGPSLGESDGSAVVPKRSISQASQVDKRPKTSFPRRSMA